MAAFRAFPVLALVSASLLAGCVAPDDGPLRESANDTAASAEVSALAHLAEAIARAGAWSGSARLTGLHATEGEPIHDLVDPPLYWNTAQDPDVGNGRALVWTYVFRSDDPNVRFYVSLGPSGSILYAGELPVPYYYGYHGSHAVAGGDAVASSPPTPPSDPVLLRPAVDSDAAAASAAGFEPFRSFGAAHPRHQVEIALQPGADGPVWYLAKRTATYFGAFVVVDGTTGAIVERGSYPGPCVDCEPRPPEPPSEMPEGVEKAWNGAIPGRSLVGAYGDSVAEETLDVESQYWFRALEVSVRADTLPSEWVSLLVFDPRGNLVWQTGGSLLEAVIPWGEEGSYRIELRTDGTSLRDIPFEGVLRVVYGEPTRRDVMTAGGSLSPWSGPVDLPFTTFGGPATLKVRLTFDGDLPTDSVHVLLEGPDGVVEEFDSTGESAEFEYSDVPDGSWRLRVWPTQGTLTPIDVGIVVEAEYPYHEPLWL